jgi:hypothetical protein
MALVDPSDPVRYLSPTAVVMTPVEQVLRQELRRLAPRVAVQHQLRPHERARIAALLRASWDAVLRLEPGHE